MESLYEFLDMGGYAFYVWSAYATTLVVLIANLISPITLRRKLLTDLKRKVRRELRNDPQT